MKLDIIRDKQNLGMHGAPKHLFKNSTCLVYQVLGSFISLWLINVCINGEGCLQQSRDYEEVVSRKYHHAWGDKKWGEGNFRLALHTWTNEVNEAAGDAVG